MAAWQELLPIPWLLAGFVAYGALVGWAWSGLEHWRLRCDVQKLHVFFASAVAVMALWLAGGSVLPGPGAHLLGMTALTLLVGWRQAMVGSLFPVFGTAFAGVEPWQTAGLFGLLLAVVPIGVTHWVWRLTRRMLPHSVVGYLAICTVLGSIVAAAMGRLALLQESLLNAGAVAAVAALRPKWLMTLPRQRRYYSR